MSNLDGIDATQIRSDFLRQWPLQNSKLPPFVHDFLDEFWQNNPAFAQLEQEYVYYQEYPKEWGYGPHLTADALVTQSGHILLVTRGEIPGKGLLALPGGFINKDETRVNASMRELREDPME